MYSWMHPEWYDLTPLLGRPADGHSASRPERSLTADQRLTSDVVQALFDDPKVTGGTVELTVQNGVAILEGTVDSDGVRIAAVTTAAGVSGVRDVCDALVVKNP
ncbi:BON domain-containing protein [Actinoplanes sp. NPDC051411]|uniref:BON domain-containing protein n=1 Tax=Actinoplanes sp. NPDC051411 TaxID=3155522 RepID=UPI00341D6180